MKLLVAAVAFVGGTLLAPELGGKAPLVALFLFALAALLGALLFASMRRSPWPALIALAFILGVMRVALIGDAGMPMYGPMYASPRSQQVDGVVLSDVEALGDFARFRLGLERIRAGGGEWMPADGVLLVSARATSEIAQQRQAPYFRYGDKLRVAGRISEPPELDGFDYAAYLARQGIVEVLDARRVTLIREGEGSVFYRSLFGFRRRLAASIAAVVPEPQAALGQATLLGLRRNIPQDLNEAFRRTGTAHLLAISGLHVGVLLGISLAGSAALLGRKHHLHLIAPLLVIWLYGLLSGMSPSATRACIMGSVYLASLAFGRQRGSLAPIGSRCRADGCRVAIHLVQHIVSAKFRGDSRHSGVFGYLRGRAEAAYRAAYRAAIPTTRATCRDYGYAGAVACSYYNDSAVNRVPL